MIADSESANDMGASLEIEADGTAVEEEPSIVWAGILRNETLLLKAAVAGSGADGVASELLKKGPEPAWVSYASVPGHASYRGGFKQGLKFHLYEEDDDDQLTIWVFAIVFDARRLSIELAKAFVEQKMVLLTDVVREMDDWKWGDHLSCQDQFGPILRQRLGEMKSMDCMDLVLSAVLDDGLELSSDIIQNNKALLRRRSEDVTVFNSWSKQQYEEKTRSVREEWSLNRSIPSSPSRSVETMDTTEVSDDDDDDVISMGDDDVISVFSDNEASPPFEEPTAEHESMGNPPELPNTKQQDDCTCVVTVPGVDQTRHSPSQGGQEQYIKDNELPNDEEQDVTVPDVDQTGQLSPSLGGQESSIKHKSMNNPPELPNAENQDDVDETCQQFRDPLPNQTLSLKSPPKEAQSSARDNGDVRLINTMNNAALVLVLAVAVAYAWKS